ncbi:MAG TPA: hypothetical protein PLJ21_09060 [Pseudobdellovibrionaceae bacterium]|nr:hypothetical protein [Pseudobdellovibrionaceae bacterium]
MIFEDLKDQFQIIVKNLFDKVEESETFQKVQERFQLLPPSLQKISLFFGTGILVLVLFLIPLSQMSSSQDLLQEFQSLRQIIRNLNHIQSTASSASQFSIAPNIEALKSNIENQLKGQNLIKTLQGPTFETSSSNDLEKSLIPPHLLQDRLFIKFVKLNLKQVLDIGYLLQTIHSSSKLYNLKMNTNREDPRYLDVHFELFTLNVPQSGSNSFSDPGESE